MQDLINQYLNIRKKIKAIEFADFVINWDSETEAPIDCFDLRAQQIGVLSEIYNDILMSDETKTLVSSLNKMKDQLPLELKKEITDLYKTIKKQECIPTNELIEYRILLAKSSVIWAKAKQENNYQLFKPYLEQIVLFNKKYVKYLETSNLKGYDILLDEYEEGSNTKFYDDFFKLLKKEIVPLVKKIVSLKSSYNDGFMKYKFKKVKQEKFAKYLMNVMCFDFNKGLIKESEHPFTSGFGTTDVRITNHYYEDLVTSSIFSVIHESGHALYEMQVSNELNSTLCSGGASMAIHESQSRFYENIIGRNYSFWEKHYPVLQKIFKKELQDTTLYDFYRYINKVENSLIRTEADELTYCLHIMIRYELEKGLINGEISVEELPKKWNELYKEYLGIDVPSDSLGVLQDIHWASGSFGYFPTYALGSAYAAQFYKAIQKKLDFDNVLKGENLKQINEWLKMNVHTFGKTKTPSEILFYATKEEFNPQYYIEYLINKYKKLYNLV